MSLENLSREELIASLKKLVCESSSIPEGTRPVLVTTAHRGVFFGYTKDPVQDDMALARCRMVVYWSADMRGVLGLASDGPSVSCRIGKPANGVVRAVTGCWDVAPAAVAKFEASPWK